MVSVLPILVPVSICNTKTLVRAESFKKFFSGEIARMHPVHVPHFNALFDRFPANTPPDEGLNTDDRLDVTLEHLLHFLDHKKYESCRFFRAKLLQYLHRLRKPCGCHSNLSCLERTTLPYIYWAALQGAGFK